MKYLNFGNIGARLMAESPTFFKRLRGWAASISAFGVALIALKSEYPTFLLFLPDHVLGYIVVFGASCAFIASLAVANPDDNSKIK